MKRTLSAVAYLVVLGVVLTPPAAEAKCRKDCKQVIGATFRTCKSECAKGKPGKQCRAGCFSARKANRMTCRKATNPTPPDCGQVATTTTTTTTTIPSTGGVVAGALTATPGRFNYNSMLGLPGANAACNTNFPGSHVCTLAELQSAPASELTGLRDTGGNLVNGFWAIDSSANPLQQCNDDAAGGSGLNWEYATAHTPSRGQKVPLTNASGALGTVGTSVQCNFSGNSWVGCCR